MSPRICILGESKETERRRLASRWMGGHTYDEGSNAGGPGAGGCTPLRHALGWDGGGVACGATRHTRRALARGGGGRHRDAAPGDDRGGRQQPWLGRGAG